MIRLFAGVKGGGGLKSEILKLTVLSIDQKIMYYNHEGIINYQLEPLI